MDSKDFHHNIQGQTIALGSQEIGEPAVHDDPKYLNAQYHFRAC